MDEPQNTILKKKKLDTKGVTYYADSVYVSMFKVGKAIEAESRLMVVRVLEDE